MRSTEEHLAIFLFEPGADDERRFKCLPVNNRGAAVWFHVCNRLCLRTVSDRCGSSLSYPGEFALQDDVASAPAALSGRGTIFLPYSPTGRGTRSVQATLWPGQSIRFCRCRAATVPERRTARPAA